MITERKRRFARYPLCFGKFSLRELCEVARKHGMQIISGIKPGMNVCNEIGLYGTPSAMRATEQEWAEAGHELKRFKRGLQLGVTLSLPRELWAERHWTEA